MYNHSRTMKKNRRALIEKILTFSVDIDRMGYFFACLDIMKLDESDRERLKLMYNDILFVDWLVPAFDSFSDEELEEVIIFFGSETGKKWLMEATKLTKRLTDVTEGYINFLLTGEEKEEKKDKTSLINLIYGRD